MDHIQELCIEKKCFENYFYESFLHVKMIDWSDTETYTHYTVASSPAW